MKAEYRDKMTGEVVEACRDDLDGLYRVSARDGRPFPATAEWFHGRYEPTGAATAGDETPPGDRDEAAVYPPGFNYGVGLVKSVAPYDGPPDPEFTMPPLSSRDFLSRLGVVMAGRGAARGNDGEQPPPLTAPVLLDRGRPRQYLGDSFELTIYGR